MLTLENIACRVEGRPLFGGVNAQIGARRRLGLVGRNGCGKTTLLRLIAGRLEPDEGRVVRARGLSVRLVDQEVPGGAETPRAAVLAADEERAGLIAEAEGAGDARRAEIEVRLGEIGAHAAPARAARLLAGLGVDEAMQRMPLADLSGGWRMRVALAAALFAEPDLLLLDEPTNHLDLEAAMWLESHLKRYPRALVVVSHDRDLLDAVPQGILHMAGGGLTLYPGNYTRFAKTHAERLAATEAQQARIDAKRRRLQGFVDRFRYNARKARQAQSRVPIFTSGRSSVAWASAGRWSGGWRRTGVPEARAGCSGRCAGATGGRGGFTARSRPSSGTYCCAPPSARASSASRTRAAGSSDVQIDHFERP